MMTAAAAVAATVTSCMLLILSMEFVDFTVKIC